MHDHDANTPLSYGEELAIAQRLIASGDFSHALHHCLGAIGFEPHRDEWHAVLRDLLVRGGLRKALEDDSYFGAKAALAWHMHDVGELGDALDLIGAVAVAVPHLGFQQWFGRWLEEAAAKHVEVDPGTVLRVLLLGTQFGIGRIKLLPAEQAAARDLAPIARFAAETLKDPQVYMLASAVLRRAGEVTDAIAMGERSRAVGGDAAQAATVIGLAHRAAGQPERAVKIFEETFAQTGDAIYLQEKFRALCDAGNWVDADALAQHLCAVKPPDSEAQMEYAYVARCLQRKTPRPHDPPLDAIRRRSLGHGQIYAMTDATANMLVQHAAQMGDEITTAVSGHEGPSNRLCIALMFAGSTDPRKAGYSCTEPFRSVSANDCALWKLDGDVVVQAMPAPSEQVLAWVDDLCNTDEADFIDLFERALRMPKVACDPREWAAASVHPRVRPTRAERTPAWLYRWQTCAMIGLACSRDRAVLASLLRGVIDWPLAAAIRVAAEVALREPSSTRAYRQALIDLVGPLMHHPNGGLKITLVTALEMLPFVGKSYLEQLRHAMQHDAHGHGHDHDHDHDDHDDHDQGHDEN